MKPPSPQEREILEEFSAPRGVWIWFTTALALAIAVEVPLILFVVAAESLFRIQTFNGFTVIIGGLAWCAIMTFVFLWPMKRMNVRALAATLRMEGEAMRTCENANRLMDEARAKYITGGLAQCAVDELAAIRAAVAREPIKPKKREISTNDGGVPPSATSHGVPLPAAGVPARDGA